MKRNKYLNTFDNTADYENYIESAYPGFPNVGLTKDNGELHYMRTSPNNHVWYGEVVDPAQALPTIQLYNNYSNVKTYTPTLDTLNNTFYIDDWGTVPTFNKLSDNFLTYKSNIKSIKKLKGLDTSNVTNMNSMFENCSKLTALDLSNLNTSNVTGTYSMFYNCQSLTSLDLSNFDTSKVTYMANMFRGCSSLTSLDLSNFDTSKVTNISSMFSDCSSLTSLDLSNWDTSKVTNTADMFANCSSLKDVYITVESTLNKLTNNLTSCDNSCIPETATIHYNGVDYKWTGSAWAQQ